MGTGRVEGKVFIVTGGTQGVGRAIAEHLAAEGATGVTICGRNRQNGEKVAAALNARGCPCEYVEADLTLEADCVEVVKRATERFGALHGLVNAAGITNRGTLEGTSAELWDLVMNINARAPFILMRETVRFMKAHQLRGSIVNIISDQYHGGAPHLTAYSASKAALAALTKNAANSLLRQRIRVNGICIGWTNTPAEHLIQLKDGRPENWLEQAEATRPFGRLILPRDVAHLATYLLCDESEMMTGSLIDFDQKVVGGFE